MEDVDANAEFMYEREMSAVEALANKVVKNCEVLVDELPECSTLEGWANLSLRGLFQWDSWDKND